MNQIETKDKIVGMLLGCAIGDALGMCCETFTKEKIKATYGYVNDYKKPDQHKWFDGEEAGSTTDDTQLTLAVAEALIESEDVFDLTRIAEKHIEAYENKHGWGNSTRTAVENLKDGMSPKLSGIGEEDNQSGLGTGNGVIMKMNPVVVQLALCLQELKQENENILNLVIGEKIHDLVYMTHKTKIADVSARMHAIIIQELLFEQPNTINFDELKKKILRFNKSNADGLLKERIEVALLSECKLIDNFNMTSQYLGGKGKERFNLIYSYPLSLFCFFSEPNSPDCIYKAVNAGGDTDTNASIVGAMLGLLHGQNVFPEHLVTNVANKDYIVRVGEKLYENIQKLRHKNSSN